MPVRFCMPALANAHVVVVGAGGPTNRHSTSRSNDDMTTTTTMTKNELSDSFNKNDDMGRTNNNMIRKSLKNPLSKDERTKEIDKLRDSFGLEAEEIHNLKSCLRAKENHGEIDHITWRREFKCIGEEIHISKVRASCLDILFYSDEDIARFRYEAFLEECGVDPNTF